MRIYISGPITNDPDFKDKFAGAAAIIAERGHEYINPAELAEVMPGANWSQYMVLDYHLLSWADAICFLPGWEQSRGATEEHAWAQVLDLMVYDLGMDTFKEFCDV